MHLYLRNSYDILKKTELAGTRNILHSQKLAWGEEIGNLGDGAVHYLDSGSVSIIFPLGLQKCPLNIGN